MRKIYLFLLLLVFVGAQGLKAQDYRLVWDFNNDEYEYVIADTDEMGAGPGWGAPWNWEGEVGIEDGQLVAYPRDRGTPGSDDGQPPYASAYDIILGTQQVWYNIEKYPYIVVKIDEMPELAEGRTDVRFQMIQRAPYSSTGNNQDFYYSLGPVWPGENNDNPNDPALYVEDYLEDGALLFHMQSGYPRWGRDISILVDEKTRTDFRFMVQGIADMEQVLKLDWIKSFETLEEAYDAIWPEVEPPVESDYRLVWDFNNDEYEYVIADTDEMGAGPGWGAPWNWEGEVGIEDGQLVAYPRDRGTPGSDDGQPPYASAYDIILGTQQVWYNIEKYPYIVVKIDEMPELAEGRTDVRFQMIQRAPYSSTGNNQDFYYSLGPVWPGENNDNPNDPALYVEDYLEDGALVFHMQSGYPRWGRDISILVDEKTRTDFRFMVQGIADMEQVLKLDWIKSFETLEEAYDAIWPEVEPPVESDYRLVWDFNNGEYEYVIADTDEMGAGPGWGNPWNWEGEWEYVDGQIVAHPRDRGTPGTEDDQPPYATAYDIWLGTQQVWYNIEKYPYIVVKIDEMPEMAEGRTDVRLQMIQRAPYSSTGNNQDFYYSIGQVWPGENNDNPNDPDLYVENYLEDGGALVFHMHSGYPRWGRDIAILVDEKVRTDFRFNIQGIADMDQVLKLDWIVSFSTLEEAYDAIWPEDPTNVSPIEVKEPEVYAFSRDGVLNIRRLEEGALVQVFDISGRVITSDRAHSNFMNIPAETGIFIIRVIDNNRVHNVKVINR